MSELLETLIADGNSAVARRARVKLQPRDKKGRWVPTGAALLAAIRGLDGIAKKYKLKAIGGTATKKGEKNKIRALLTEDAPDLGLEKNTVLEVDPKNGELDTGIKLDRDFLKRKGIDPDLQHTLPKSIAEMPESVDEMNPQPADEVDLELANNGLSDEEDKDFRSEREQEPLAKLPPGMEELSKEEVSELLTSKEDESDPLGAWVASEPAEITDPQEVFDNPFGNWKKPSVEEYSEAMKKSYEEMTDEELAKVIAYTREFARRFEPDADGGISKNQNDFAREEARRRKLGSDVSPEEKAVRDVVAEAFYGGDVDPEPEALLREVAQSGETPRKRTAAAGLEPGDVIRDANGNDEVIVDITNAGGGRVRLKTRLGDGSEGGGVVDGDRPFSVFGPKRRLERPAAPEQPEDVADEPEAPEAEAPQTPEEPEAPEAPETPEEAPETDTPEASESEEDLETAEEVTVQELVPADFPPANRIDDGSNFDIESLSAERKAELRGRKLTPVLDADGTPAKFLNENNVLKTAEDPFEIMSALAEAYPNAKFTPNGMALVLHRQEDKDGKIFEVRASNSGKKAIVYTMRWTDPETGEVEEFQYKNDAHSISAALGAYDAEYLLDRILGRKPEHEILTYGRGDSPTTRATMQDTLRKRARVAFMATDNPADTKRKLVTLRENAIRLAQGRNTVLHKNRGTKKDSEIPSLWDSFDAFIENRDDANKEDFYHVLYSIFGRAPMDEASHAVYRTALRDEFTRRYKGKISNKDTRAFHGLLTSASERMRGIYRDSDPQVRANRYASKDRTRAIEEGMTVEYTNNVGETSTLKVTKLVANTAAETQGGDVYDYGDYVIVTDAAGNTRKINALRLQILKNQDAELTRYRPNLQGAALVEKRQEQGLIGPDISRELPGQTSVISDVPEGPKMADDFVAGDTLPNKNGGPIGKIIAVRPITSRNGNPGYAFLVRKPDGEEVRVNYAQGTELELKKA